MLAVVALTLAACNSNKSKNETTGNTDTNNIVTTKPDTSTTTEGVTANAAEFSTKEIIDGYLQLKNALTADKPKDAASAANSMKAALSKVNNTTLSADKQKIYADLQEGIREHTEHIGSNAGNLEHQREHFIMLSRDMASLIKNFGNNGQTLYKDFCPMADNGKGALWISEIKEIKNPFYGTKMISCGSVKETIN